MIGTLGRNIIRQRPRLLYAGSLSGSGWLNVKRPAENAEIFFVSAGSGKTEIGENSYPFKTGDLIVFNRGCEHREYADDTESREIFFLGLGNLRLFGTKEGDILPDKDFRIVGAENFADALKAYFSGLVYESETKLPLHDAISENLLKLLLLTTVRLVSPAREDMLAESTRYLAAKKYMDEHFTEIDSVESVCKELSVNKYYLSHLFTQKEGVPPVRYLINKRIQLACDMLEASDDNVADIGKRCGYDDPCYFSRTFKRVKGVTPLRYRYLFKLDRDEKAKAEKKK